MALLARAKVFLHFTSTAKHLPKEQTRHKQRAASTNMPTEMVFAVAKHTAGPNTGLGMGDEVSHSQTINLSLDRTVVITT